MAPIQAPSAKRPSGRPAEENQPGKSAPAELSLSLQRAYRAVVKRGLL